MVVLASPPSLFRSFLMMVEKEKKNERVLFFARKFLYEIELILELFNVDFVKQN